MANKTKNMGIMIDIALMETVVQIAEIKGTTAQELFEGFARQYVLDNSQELAREITRLRTEMQKPHGKPEPTGTQTLPVNKTVL